MDNKLSIKEQKAACTKFFDELAKELDGYVIIESCNEDFSRYLVPHGTESQITYESKPNKSFRVSDHWNWYANTRKCPNPHYIQCYTKDLPRAKSRLENLNKDYQYLRPSPAIWASAVAFADENGEYQVIFGEKFNRKTREWSWVTASVKDVIRMINTK